jgi:hypothetical protein
VCVCVCVCVLYGSKSQPRRHVCPPLCGEPSKRPSAIIASAVAPIRPGLHSCDLFGIVAFKRGHRLGACLLAGWLVSVAEPCLPLPPEADTARARRFVLHLGRRGHGNILRNARRVANVDCGHTSGRGSVTPATRLRREPFYEAAAHLHCSAVVSSAR